MRNIKEIIKYTQNLKLLYVEDNENTRDATIMILEELFDNIIVAVDGKDGFEKFNNNDIDLIMTDVNMPKMNGLDMVEKVRELNADIPILVLSAYNESGYFIDSIKLGVEGYLLKPINLEQFLSVLGKVTTKLKLQYEVKKSQQLLTQYKEITDKSAIVTILDKNHIITYANDIFCEISEYSNDELVGNDYHSILNYQQSATTNNEIWQTIEIDKKIWDGVLKFVSKNGKVYYLKTTIKPILDSHGEIIEYIALRYDVTQIMNPKIQLLEALRNTKKPLLIYFKLEDFDTIDEFYSNKIVEKIQDEVSIYLQQNIPPQCKFDKVYQLGNGEFAMSRENIIDQDNKDRFISTIKTFQDAIENSTIDVGDIHYDMSLLISLAYEDENILTSAKLGIRDLLKSKQKFIVSNNFAKIEYDKAERNLKAISMVKQAILDDKIISYFQAIVDNKTQKVAKYESLVRLVDEENKIVSPYFFLEISKKGRYYSQITNIVLQNSFNVLKLTDADISMNLSALDIEQKSTRDKIFELLEEHKESTHRVVFELLEDESVKDFNTITNFISDVKELGVKIAIDDFGAGYSNFERLLDYQPNILKIDACLIKNIATDNYSLSVVKTIVSFAKEQKIQTVAEYVENETIFNIIKDLGVDFSQGYYFAKPEPLGES
ncbi:MAG: EAL domain-containing protein [Campylobacterota bacterium]|nr:EAL domain-containing protein [Campylobacterota bacterium]